MPRLIIGKRVILTSARCSTVIDIVVPCFDDKNKIKQSAAALHSQVYQQKPLAAAYHLDLH